MQRDGGAYFRLLADIHDVFVRGEDSINPQPQSLGGLFLGATHGSYLAAANLALSLHVVDAYKPLRGCLESAVYALHVERDPAAYTRWKERPIISALSDTANVRQEQLRLRKKIGREFSVSNILSEIADVTLRARVDRLYDETIDYGAHYNFPAFRHHFEIVDADNQEIRAVILTGKESEFVFCFKKIAEVALTSLAILNLAYGTQWDQQIIASKIAGLTRAMQKRHPKQLRRRKS